jgi:hypothetical protein
VAEVCIANIGARGRRTRLWVGVAEIAGALVIAAILVATMPEHGYRLFVAVPLMTGLAGVFQAREKT